MSKAENYTRWAAFEKTVLSKVNDPEKCREVIIQRQQEVDDEMTEAQLVASFIREHLCKYRHDPDTCCVFIASANITEMLVAATGKRFPINKATPHLRTLAIPQLRYSAKNGVPGWIWRGPNANPKQTALAVSLPVEKPRSY